MSNQPDSSAQDGPSVQVVNDDTGLPLRLPAAPCSAANTPAALAIGPAMWADFCDWWTGQQGKAKFQNRDEALFLFTIGYQAGHDRSIPLKLACERILNWWRCDGGMDTLGAIMDDLESVLESQQNGIV